LEANPLDEDEQLKNVIELVRMGLRERDRGNVEKARTLLIRASRELESLLGIIEDFRRLLVVKLLERVNREIKNLENSQRNY